MSTVPFALQSRGWRAGVALICTLVPATAPAQARAPGQGAELRPPRQQLVLRNLAVLRWNPLGLIDDARLQYRYRLYDSATPLGRDNYAGLTASAAAAPTMARYGLAAEVQPLSVWSLWVALEREQYWGTWSTLQSFSSATQDFRDSTLAKRGDRGDHYATSGTQVTLGTQVQAQIGSVAARSQGRLAWLDMPLRSGDRVFYSPIHDLLLGSRGWFVTADTDLVWRGGGPWTLGVRWSLAQALYRPNHLAPGEDLSLAPGMLQRAGPLLQYAWAKRHGQAADHTLTVVANWWLASPTRTGQDPSRPRAVPYLLVAYGWALDLLAGRGGHQRE